MEMKFSLVSVVVLVISFSSTYCETENPRVKISNGELKGTYLKSREDKTYSAFLGIPYAKPPKRFQLAEPPETWNGIRDATKFGEICWQRLLFTPESTIMGSEDCLFVNVYVPGKATEKNLPVMVFIHGGGFVCGSSDEYLAKFFMDQDIILVTLNYRLGALGFLTTGDGVIEGNLGLKDQHLALKWVQKNIEAFGGDRKRVTIFGESAGGASVHYQVLSPLNQGLFQHAIIQSGAATSPWAHTDNPAEEANRLGNALGCNTESSKELLKCLKGKTALEITSIEYNEWHIDPVVQFRPVTDSPKSKQVFITEHPKAIMESGKFNKVPLIMTACMEEGILLHAEAVLQSEKLTKEINEEFLRVLPITLNYNDYGLTESQQNWVSSQIKKFYFGENEIGRTTFANLTNMYSDRWFFDSMQKAAQFHAKHVTVHAGLFTYRGENSLISAIFGFPEPLGFSHGDDLLYLFDGDFMPKLTPNSADENASKFFVNIWAQFAKTGKAEFKWQDFKWVPLSSKKPNWLSLNFPPEMLENPLKDRLAFWDKVWQQTRKDEL